MHEFPHLYAQVPSLTGFQHYLPNAAIVSSIMDALFQTNSMDPLATSRLLLTNPGKFIFSCCNTIGLDNPCTPVIPLQGRNWILACYDVSLICGDTLSGICICHAMLMGYIKQALLLHADRGLLSPTLVDLGYIIIMTTTVKKYKELPKCQEMVSNGMFHFITSLACRALRDSFVHAITNWIILGSYTRF